MQFGPNKKNVAEIGPKIILGFCVYFLIASFSVQVISGSGTPLELSSKMYIVFCKITTKRGFKRKKYYVFCKNNDGFGKNRTTLEIIIVT